MPYTSTKISGFMKIVPIYLFCGLWLPDTFLLYSKLLTEWNRIDLNFGELAIFWEGERDSKKSESSTVMREEVVTERIHLPLA